MKTLNKKIILEHKQARANVLAEDFDVWTSKLERLRKKHNLQQHEKIAFRIPQDFASDGASTHTVYQFLIWIWVFFIFISSTVSLQPVWYSIFGLATLLIAINLNPLNKWLLPPAIIHDYLWRHLSIRAYVYDIFKEKITRELGAETVTFREGTEVMEEKMTSFYAPGFWKKVIILTLEVVRLINKRK